MGIYQALYRKYRPTAFSDVVGQTHITRTLQKQVAEGRTSHAYLFTGSRGTGKTTCAKILARAVNCENPSDGNPCGQCAACKALEEGASLDVLELDAASNNGVDQVRALRDEAVYPPANVRKRVYIVDEVHMLSTSAFNALLKILEEPPEHLMFILATTELHKVPATILSRCQRYAFRRIQPRDIAARLRYVARQERIPLTDDGAELLARLAEGAMRDGLSLLDQCAASGGTVDSAAVLDTLGLAGHLQTAQLLERLLQKDVPAALALFGELYDNGRDGHTVLQELSSLVRDLLLRRMAPEGSAALLSGGYDANTLDRLERLASGPRLLYMANALQSAGAERSDAANSRLSAELCLLRLCDETLSGDLSALVSRVERLESALTSSNNYPAAAMPDSRPAAAMPDSRPAATSSNKRPRAASGVPTARASPWEAVPDKSASPWEVPPDNAAPLSDNDAPPIGSPSDNDAPPWDEYAPPPDTPPWEIPPEYDAPSNTTPDNALSNVPAPDNAPPSNVPAPPNHNAPPSDSPALPDSAAPTRAPVMDWDALSKRCRELLPPMYGSFLGQCTGVLDDGLLTLYAPDALTMKRLNNPRVTTILLEESGAERVTVRQGEAPSKAPDSPRKNRDELLSFSRQRPDIIRIIGDLPPNQTT